MENTLIFKGILPTNSLSECTEIQSCEFVLFWILGLKS